VLKLSCRCRLKVNQNVPCYFLAFPPFINRETRLTGYECPLKEEISVLEPVRNMGFYEVGNIMQCDSYLGILFFLLGLICTFMTVLVYNYIIYRLVNQAAREYKESRWVRPLYNVRDIYQSELQDYNHTYPLSHRLLLRIRSEVLKQYQYVVDSCVYIVTATFGLVQCFVSIALCPVTVLCAVPMFFLKRMFILFCNDCTKEGRQRKLIEGLRKKEKEADMRKKMAKGGYAKLDFDDDDSHAHEHDVELVL